MESFVTADEVAGYLKTTRRQVLELTRQGVLPAHPLFLDSRRKSWRYKLTEIDLALETWPKKPSEGQASGRKGGSDGATNTAGATKKPRSNSK